MDYYKMKSDKKLQEQSENLFKIKKIMQKFGLPCFVTDGLALGIVRKKDFINWDNDVDLLVFENSYRGNKNSIINALIKEGFEVTYTDGEKKEKIKAKKDDFVFELRTWYYESNHYVRNIWGRKFSVPAKFFRSWQPCMLRGQEYFIPFYSKAYLTHVYGDWKTIKRGAWDDYLSDKFYLESKKK